MDLLTRLLGLYILLDILKFIMRLTIQLMTIRIKERIPVHLFTGNDRQG